MVGDEESMPKSGVLTSPNYPESYPNNHDSTQTIEVAEGKTIQLSWTSFNTERKYDYVTVVNEDVAEVVLTGYDLPANFDSDSNILHIKFHTDGDTQSTGWRLEWTEQ